MKLIALIALLCVSVSNFADQAMSDIEISTKYSNGTIVSTFKDDMVSYKFTEGRMKGAFAKNLRYESHLIGEYMYFVVFHDTNNNNRFTLVIDLKNKREFTSAIMSYKSDRSYNFVTDGEIINVKRL